MWNKSKRKFLKSIGTAGIFLAGVNLPVWAINTSVLELYRIHPLFDLGDQMRMD